MLRDAKKNQHTHSKHEAKQSLSYKLTNPLFYCTISTSLAYYILFCITYFSSTFVITAIIPFWIIPLMSGFGMIVASFFNELFGPNILAITSMGILSSMSLATWIFITCQLGLPIHLMMAVDSLTLILNILMMIFVLKGDFQPNIRYSITMLISATLMAGTFACL
ncbi:hypothetical protein N9Y17_05110 [Gammaproteobacteria bacterium]|nr:hypothetical protein [Gammaproteobacteria bacterium]